ncbi:hypothetical protein [Neisseria iguanae]|uniref:hypothetical protein n=1 Tax=Neisseria iguanae TaxID=90242 RepID=UPI001B809109|nr:hypothetical protein [Neisseria iguanae]
MMIQRQHFSDAFAPHHGLRIAAIAAGKDLQVFIRPFGTSPAARCVANESCR